jgi:hypothetical protein
MNNRNPDLEQEEQQRREQELREEQERMVARGQVRQSPDGGDEGKDPVIINRGG